jgi:hypothetical protein
MRHVDEPPAVFPDPDLDWSPMMLPGADAERIGSTIVSKGDGRVFFGPYRSLPPGDYTLSVEIDSNAAPPASFELQAVADGRRIALGKADIHGPAGRIELPFSAPAPTQGAPCTLEFLLDGTGGGCAVRKIAVAARGKA